MWQNLKLSYCCAIDTVRLKGLNLRVPEFLGEAPLAKPLKMEHDAVHSRHNHELTLRRFAVLENNTR